MIDLSPHHLETVKRILAEHVPDCEVRAFGSRATWTAWEYSDLDLAVVSPEPLDRRTSANLREAFEESDLPIRVDVVEWATLTDGFRQAIEGDCVVLQEAATASDWPEARLGEVAEIVMGQSPPGDTISRDGGLALLNGPTEFGAHHPTPVQFTADARKIAQPGDILFCVRGSTTGRMNWADQEYAIGRGIAAIRHRRNPELQPFVRGVIEYQLPDLLAQATGSTFPNVSANQLAAIPLPRLGEDEQRRIAGILGALDDKIELNRRMSQTLEAMAQALFKSWFVDFDPVRAKMEGRWRPGESLPGLPEHHHPLFPDRLVPSELGDIPEGWEVGTLSDVAKQMRDNKNPLKTPETMFSHFSIPAFDDDQMAKQELGENIKSVKTRVRPDTVLLSMLNPEIERVWLSDVAPDEPAICSTEFLVLEPRPPFRRSYVYLLARSTPFRRKLESLVTGTSKSHQRARANAVLALQTIFPPPHILRAFDQQASPPLNATVRYRSQVATLATVRGALLPRFIAGEVWIGGHTAWT